ncbi:phosphoribosyltransferase domain-containing protein, partial [Bacillus mycoides]|uniref:phosphoribosyltransferase domain-containing protein n=1 Tax=Bacillus mycoides TaxID=1405 RepID=UPI001642EFAC
LQYQFPFKQQLLFIPFAQTPTALPQPIFQSFQHPKYLHTTTQIISQLQPIITFQQQHSHPTSHPCYRHATYFRNDHP